MFTCDFTRSRSEMTMRFKTVLTVSGIKTGLSHGLVIGAERSSQGARMAGAIYFA